jgi:KaiC/GvpD/RAD55 family RecA-like ATPase
MRIPSEIRKFFEIEEGQTLLIKGLPGTGKTTLALELMNALCERKNGMYISTRVDPKRLYAVNPWVKEVLLPKNVVNATRTKLLRSLQGREISNYDAVLDFFKIFFDEAEEIDNPMIVVDSWDAILNYTAKIMGDAQHGFEQNMCEFARDLGIHLIFVSEFSDVAPLDYIVDGVVTMENFRLRGTGLDNSSGMRTRYVRQIRLEKLRGVEIRQKTYIATLHGGRFRYFEPYREHTDARIGGDVVRIPDPSDGRISSGIPDLDSLIGGFKYGSCNVLEIDYGVGKRYYQMLTALASNALKNGRGVFILPSIGYQLSSRDIFVPTNVVVSQPKEDEDLEEWGDEILGKWDDLRERTGKPILNIIGMDAMEFAFGYKAVLNMTNRMIRRWKETNDVNVMVVKSGQESINMAVHTADTYLLVNELNGGLCIYGVIPRTEPLNMLLEERNSISLTPIV